MKHRMNRYSATSVALFFTLGFSSALQAQTATESDVAQVEVTAADHAKRAKIAYDVQDWVAAAREYMAAYTLEQKSEYLWGLAQAQRLGGDFANAIQAYNAYKRSGVSTSQGNAAEMMVLKCDAEVAKAEAEQARAAMREHDESAASATVLPIQVAPEAEPPDDSGLGIGWLVVGTLATAGLGAAATWSGIDTQNAASVYDEAPTEEGYNDGKNLELRTNILLGATALAATGTVIIAIFTDWSSDQEEEDAQSEFHVTPAVGKDGGGLLVEGRF